MFKLIWCPEISYLISGSLGASFSLYTNYPYGEFQLKTWCLFSVNDYWHGITMPWQYMGGWHRQHSYRSFNPKLSPPLEVKADGKFHLSHRLRHRSCLNVVFR